MGTFVILLIKLMKKFNYLQFLDDTMNQKVAFKDWVIYLIKKSILNAYDNKGINMRLPLIKNIYSNFFNHFI